MKPKQIVEKLCSHEINKDQAINLIEEIIETLKSKKTMMFFVEHIAFTSESNDAILHLKAPYCYESIKGRVENGDSIDVIIF